MMSVVAVAADQHVVAVAAGDRVVAGAAVHVQLDHGRPAETGGGHDVVAAEGIHDELVVGPFGARTAISTGRPATVKLVPLPVIWIVSAWAVPLTMTVSAWPSPVPLPGGLARSRFTCVDVGAGQIVDGDRVGAAEGDDVDLLDAVDVHGHVANVAGQPQPAAVGRQVDTSR